MAQMFDSRMSKNLTVIVAVLYLCGLAVTDAACTTKTVSSNNYMYKRQTINKAIQVTSMTLQNQISNSLCARDYSYGIYGPTVWVDKGCRGSFRICYTEGTLVTASCDSQNFKEKRCTQTSNIRTLTINSQDSNSPCVENFSYFKDGNVLVVDKGCRASFFIGL